MNLQESQKLENKVLNCLQKYLKVNNSLILGVSGGPDSVFLLHLVNKLKFKKIIAAHINHLLRGKESDKDEEYTRQLAQKFGNIYELEKAKVAEISKKDRLGIEEVGRKVRYSFFQKLAKKHRTKYILTAHHADDNIETIIMNFVRGSSLKGLSGMEEKENFGSNLFLIRPMLGISKNEIMEYLKLKKIAYRTDKSNDDQKYTRNFIRHKIVPELKKLNPNLIISTAKNSENLRETNSFIESEAKKFLNKNLKKDSISAKKFRQLNRVIQKIVLLNLLPSRQDIEKKHLDEVLTLIEKNIGNKKKKFGSLTINLRRNIIYLEKNTK